jgi:hypothetical protein
MVRMTKLFATGGEWKLSTLGIQTICKVRSVVLMACCGGQSGCDTVSVLVDVSSSPENINRSFTLMMNAKGFSKTPCTYIERLRDATFQKIVI